MSEDKNPIRILICILTTYERTGWPHPELLDFVYSLRFNNKYATAFVKAHNFHPAAGARNFFLKNMKEAQADWLLMIDNDMSPPQNILDTIEGAPEDASVVVPRFHLWANDHGTTKLCWGLVNEPENVGDVQKVEPGFHELTKCGTGAIFIRPSVITSVPAPWFFYTYDEDGNMTSTEDINFSLKIREHGHKIYGNSAIEVGHHHTVDLCVLNRILYPAPKEAIDKVEEVGLQAK